MPKSTTFSNSPCAVILTAIPIEYSSVKQHITDLKEFIYKGKIYEKGKFKGAYHGWEIGIAEVGTGNNNKGCIR